MKCSLDVMYKNVTNIPLNTETQATTERKKVSVGKYVLLKVRFIIYLFSVVLREEVLRIFLSRLYFWTHFCRVYLESGIREYAAMHGSWEVRQRT